MGDHLTVDLGLIRATGEGLGHIKDVLQDAEAAQPGAAVLGSGELAGAMDEFVDNWKIHRDKLVASVDAHQKMALDSAEAYQNTDAELAKEQTRHGSSGEAPARAASGRWGHPRQHRQRRTRRHLVGQVHQHLTVSSSNHVFHYRR